MKSWWMTFRPGGCDLDLRDMPVPAPGPRQLLLRLRAAGLNRGEFLTGQAGVWKAAGGEGAGEVVEAGSEVVGFAPGDRVMGRCAGAFSEYAVMEAFEAMHVPEPMTWEQAGAFPMTAMVSYDMLVAQGRLQAGEWVLVNGITSGVGVTCLQMAKVLGAKVIGTSRSQDKLDQLAGNGLDIGLCASTSFAANVLEATQGQGVNLAVNAVGGSVLAEEVRCMAYEGRIAIVGYVDRVGDASLDVGTLHSKRLSVFGVSNKLRTPAQRADAVAQFKRDLLPQVGERMRPLIDHAAAFDDLPAAKERIEADRHVGKVVLRISGAGGKA